MTTATVQSDAKIAERFGRLAVQWKRQRGPTSSISEMSLQPAYQQIIGLGPAAIPLLLQEIERTPDHWFWALKSITGEDPVPAEHRGDLAAMTEDWLRWGREQGHVA